MTRVKPTDDPHAWQHTKKSIKLDPQWGKASQDYNFDEILTGSENKPVYTAVARSHVYAAMDGYNAVIFAYGQTASGKTFTLVRYHMAIVMPANDVLAVWRRRATWDNTTIHERYLWIHQTDPNSRIPATLLLPRNLQRNHLRPACTSLAIRRTACTNTRHGPEHNIDTTPRRSRHLTKECQGSA